MFALPVTFTAAALMGLLLSTCSASSTPIGSAFLKKTAAHLRKLQGTGGGAGGGDGGGFGGGDGDDSPEWKQWGCTGDGELFLNKFDNAQCGGDPTGTTTQAMFEAHPTSEDMFTCMDAGEGMSMVYTCDNGDPIMRMFIEDEECSGNPIVMAMDDCDSDDDDDDSDSESDGDDSPEWEQWGCTGVDGELFLNKFDNAQCGGDPTGTTPQAVFEAHPESQDMFTCMFVQDMDMSVVYTCDDNGDPIARMYQNEECSGNPIVVAMDDCDSDDDDDDSDDDDDGYYSESTFGMDAFNHHECAIDECGMDAFNQAVDSEGDNTKKACAEGEDCIAALEDAFDVDIDCGDDDDDDLESAAVSLKTGSFLVTTMLGAIILVSWSK